MNTSDLSQGQAEISLADGATYAGIKCSFHGGEEVIAVDDDGKEVFSTAVGFQPDCLACWQTASLTVEHINAFQAHDEATTANISLGAPMRYFIDEAHRQAWDDKELVRVTAATKLEG